MDVYIRIGTRLANFVDENYLNDIKEHATAIYEGIKESVEEEFNSHNDGWLATLPDIEHTVIHLSREGDKYVPYLFFELPPYFIDMETNKKLDRWAQDPRDKSLYSGFVESLMTRTLKPELERYGLKLSSVFLLNNSFIKVA